MLMYNFIDKLVKLNSDIDCNKKFKEIITINNELRDIAVSNKIPMGPGVVGGSPCDRDLFLWYLFARTTKPRKVFEIGTWIGTSTIVIAKALHEIYGEDFEIVTCDYPNNVYIENHNYKYLLQNIYYNNLHSNQLVPTLKENGHQFDAIFSDAAISDNNVNDLKDICNMNKFIFLTHDVYTTKYSKGNEAVNKIQTKYKDLKIIVPEHEDGYTIDNINYKINNVTGVMLSKEIYESII